MTTALYDLGKHPTTFDFAAWAVIARTHGADHVQFIYEGHIADWKYPQHTAWKRFGNIILPICTLAGLKFSVGRRIEGLHLPYLIGDVETMYKKLGRVELLKPVALPTQSGYVTVTLRESFRTRYRNSNIPAWQQFVEYVERRGKEVIVLPECEQSPIDLIHRMTLYAGADMNLGVNNGPMTLCLYSAAPYIMLNMMPVNNTGEKTYDMERLLRGCGFPPGSQFSFRTDKQQIVWEPDTFDNIVRAYEGAREEMAA